METYRIIRFCRDDNNPDHKKVIKSGLTREEAIEYCNSPESEEGGVWFDGFEKDED